MYSPNAPILGTPQASPSQITRFILSLPHGGYNAHDIADVIVPAYVRCCVSVGVDFVMLVAQLIHETGNLSSWWSQRPRRNPAGIGVTGHSVALSSTAGAGEQPTGAWAIKGNSWLEGVSFPSWENDAVPAHVGRLLAYALRAGQGTSAQRVLISRALAVRSLPASFRGVAPTWRALNGRWAVPGTTYADSIAAIANAICRR